MGGAAGFFLELTLFIGFKYKLNMTTWWFRPWKSPSSCLLSTILQV